MRKPTIQDVARCAGVGVGTVSRVLNNHAAVKPTTREAVLQAMTDLNYTPNPHARRVAGGRSYAVSVLLPVVSTEFYLRLLDGLESAFHEQRYDLAIFPLFDRARLERYLGSHTLAYQADGLVMASYNLADLFEDSALPTQQPVVLVDGYSASVDCSYVDNELGGRLAAQQAISCGGELRAIWLETEFDHVFSHMVLAERREGFLQALNEAGVSLAGAYSSSLNGVNARTVAAELLDEARFPCTVFASADLLAAAVLDEAQARGLSVGEQLKVIGFDDQPWAAARGLTTLRQPVEAMGRAGAELLLSRLSGHTGPPRARRFEPVMVTRASTGTG
ncbi:LacI family DNA-binding transcriptional regulator [Deinococcus peraridilitoris]|uniref:Transcriptional regulator n=1 Tax=Deinococcus peraridilitoris (strain DSM 19664 / LMG 22246 / CIP 109416 / KR-200) TaxID=937777 RepID=K9ZXM2_DEIPD|nr:LacI family DNA-binding transcriptional regulator [Deinococcus peraridilitoris]AFZ65949.1 transcriptional regulator [Deinococcus peraridilitoris DSM 19664]